MTAPKKPAAPAASIPVQSRILVSLICADEQTAAALDASDRGAWSMSPRNFVVGQYFRVGSDYFKIMAVIHDPADPAGISLVVSSVKGWW